MAQFRAGKDKAFNALVGQAMKASKGKANPAQVNELLRKKLGAEAALRAARASRSVSWPRAGGRRAAGRHELPGSVDQFFVEARVKRAACSASWPAMKRFWASRCLLVSLDLALQLGRQLGADRS